MQGSQIGTTFISIADIYEKEELLHLKDLFASAKQIKGIAGYHFIQYSKEMELVTKMYSSESSTAIEDSKESEGEDTSHSKLIEVSLGKWYAVY